jgi:hypothetical protein
MSESENKHLHTVLEELFPDRSSVEPVSLERIREWMGDPNLDVQGAVCDFITAPGRAARIVPALTFEDYWAFLPRYLERCIIENPDSEWAHSRWAACHKLLWWFGALWDDPSINMSPIRGFKELLERLYLHGEENIRLALVQGTLEHLFENSSVREFFADWKSHPELRRAYDEAADWYLHGGHSSFAPKATR